MTHDRIGLCISQVKSARWAIPSGAVADELLDYIEKRLQTLSRRYGRDHDFIENNAAFSAHEKDARKGALWHEINVRKDELKRIRKRLQDP